MAYSAIHYLSRRRFGGPESPWPTQGRGAEGATVALEGTVAPEGTVALEGTVVCVLV